VTGWIRCDVLGGRLPIIGGTVELVAPASGSHPVRAEYRLHFADAVGHPLTLAGSRHLPRSGSGKGCTRARLPVRVLAGHVAEAGSDRAPEVVGAGVLAIRTDLAGLPVVHLWGYDREDLFDAWVDIASAALGRLRRASRKGASTPSFRPVGGRR
jgi:hypothetical protein